MKFPYLSYEVDPPPAQPGILLVHRPVIPIRIFGNARSGVFYGLLDTGADDTVLPRSLADFIGVTTVAGQSAKLLSAAGETSAVYGEVTFEIGRGRGRLRWRASVGIVDGPWAEAMLGHTGFLRYSMRRSSERSERYG